MSNQGKGALPRYLARPASVEAQQPGLIAGAKVYSFGFTGDRDAIDATAGKYLNAGTDDGLTYRAVSPVVLATFLDAEKLTSTSDPYGWLRDRESALWVLLGATYAKGGKQVIERLVWWMPHVWVDTAAAMMTGRGVWGFPKSIGRFEIPLEPEDKARFVASTRVYKTIAPTTEGVFEPLLSIERRHAGILGDLESIWTDVTSAVEAFAGILHEIGRGAGVPSLGLTVDLIGHLLHREVPIVNLKQFRDAADGRRACFQALVEGPCRIKTLRGGGLLPGEFSTTIFPCESHPLVDELGLSSETPEVRFAAWVDMDFVAEDGREVWRAGEGLIGAN